MTTEEMAELFEHESDEYIEFERVKKQLHRRPDIHAFLLLDRLLPKAEPHDIISGAEHDEIYLDVDIDELAKVITREDIVELTRCGVRFDKQYDCLAMFV